MSEVESRLTAFLSRKGVPAWFFTAANLAWLVADYFGRFDFWSAILGRVGGNAVVMADILTQPLIPISLACFGAYLWWFLTDPDTDDYNRTIYSGLTWILTAIIVGAGLSFVLFVDFVNTSRIPELVTYMEVNKADRYVSQKQERELYKALRKTSESIPKFQVSAIHDIEALQYASTLMSIFNLAGIKLANGDAGSAYPNAMDIYSTSDRGLMIVVANADQPPRPALDLQDAFKSASIITHFINGRGMQGDEMFLLVGPK